MFIKLSFKFRHRWQGWKLTNNDIKFRHCVIWQSLVALIHQQKRCSSWPRAFRARGEAGACQAATAKLLVQRARQVAIDAPGGAHAARGPQHPYAHTDTRSSLPGKIRARCGARTPLASPRSRSERPTSSHPRAIQQVAAATAAAADALNRGWRNSWTVAEPRYSERQSEANQAWMAIRASNVYGRAHWIYLPPWIAFSIGI
jgi:hypothetical protein